MTIGLFDSGLGGLSVVRRVREHLPRADLLFFADQAHVPYGDRSDADLLQLLRANLAWLDDRNVAAIVAACNTSCAMAERHGWPATRAPVLDIIAAAAAAVERSGARKVGVVATAATVSAGSYGRALRARVPRIDVVEVAAPELVPLVESGAAESAAARAAVARSCAQLPPDLEAVVLGCTHYPALAAHFRIALGDRVAIIDPAVVQAERTAALGLPEGNGTLHCVTNGPRQPFARAVERLFADATVASIDPASITHLNAR